MYVDMKLNILCVDDSATFRTILNLAFVGWSQARHVKVIADSTEAVSELLRAYNDGTAYDIIVLDIEMGPPNGIELARQIRLLSSYRTTPVYFLTSTQNENLIHTAKLLGADVVQKSRHIGDQLLEALTQKFAVAV